MRVRHFGVIRRGADVMSRSGLESHLLKFSDLGRIPPGEAFSGDEIDSVARIFQKALSSGGLIFSSRGSARLVAEPLASQIAAAAAEGAFNAPTPKEFVGHKLDSSEGPLKVRWDRQDELFPGLAAARARRNDYADAPADDGAGMDFKFGEFELRSVTVIDASAGRPQGGNYDERGTLNPLARLRFGQKLRNRIERLAVELGFKYCKIYTPEDGRGFQAGSEIFKTALLEPSCLVVLKTSPRAGLAIDAVTPAGVQQISAAADADGTKLGYATAKREFLKNRVASRLGEHNIHEYPLYPRTW